MQKNNQPLVKSYSRIIAEIEQAISEKRNSEKLLEEAKGYAKRFAQFKGIVPV